MSISSALFSGISGLSTNGNAMSVIGDNIANVNTIGYKSSRTTFQDVLAQSVATASGTSQIGRGAALSSIDTLFQQGSFESTSNATDLAIGGQGFFIVSPRAEDTQYYTRAGQFRFDADGYFINPEGYVGRGWALDDNGNDVGTLQPVRLSAFTSPPEPTNAITAITNLNSQEIQATQSLFNPLSGWDANSATGEPIGDAQYSYQTSIRVYDSLGRSHDVTVYYDKAAGSEYDDGTPTNNIDNTWEYIVTSNPDDDLRTAFAAADSRGILMRGTVSFNATTGALDSQTAFVCNSGDPDDNANWVTADFSTNGYPEVNAQFVAGVDQTIATEFGTRSTDGAWGGPAVTSVDDVATAGLPTSSWQPQALTSTQYASSSTTIYQTQDGYGTGFLENISVGTDGIMVGHYSNGQILNLFRVGIAKFNNQQALSKVGGNLWSATRDSGDAITGHPGENGLGRVSSNSLEQSNVDIAAEFVKMITTERGFQANSRIITTVDNMLQELINLKR
jgi:flagellar hook protein FlgE